MLLPIIANGAKSVDSEALVKILSSDAESVSLAFDLTVVEKSTVAKDDEIFTTHTMANSGVTLKPGYPQLPAVTRFVVVPPNAGLELVIDASDPRQIDAEHPPNLCTETDLPDPIEPYNPEEIYPSVIAEMGDPVVIRGVRLVTVTTYPVRYDPASNSYLYYDKIKTDIRYTDSEPVNPAYVPIRKNRSPEFMKFLRSIAINTDDVGRDDPDDEAPYIGHQLVVVHENCLEYVAPFIEWRRQSGWKMEILSIPSNIATNFNSVKNRIKDVYDEYLDEGVDPFDHIFIIGDLPNNLNHGPAVRWVIATQSFHGDYFYACLEGNDNHADVGVSRWFAGNPETLEMVMIKAWAYEVEPYMEDTEWFTRGAVYAQRWARNYHVSLATNVNYGVTVLESLGFDDIRVDINMDQDDGGGGRVGPFIRDQYNDGTNVMIGRAENYYFRGGLPGVDNNEIFPIDIYLGGHQEHSAYELIRRGTPNNPIGAVAVTSSYGNPSTIVNSILWLEIVNGFLQHDLTFGWSYLKGLIAPVEYFPGFENIAQTYRGYTGFFGDPALHYWKGVPTRVEAEFSNVISTYPRLYTVTVTGEEGEIENAQVTLYAPGDIPEFDDDDYSSYNDMQMWTAKTDVNGVAQFLFEDVTLDEDTPLHVTVTGRNILPLMQEARIESPDAEMTLEEFSVIEIEGNGDGDPNPGETIAVVLTGRNIGNQGLENVSATVSSTSPWIQIVNNEIQFGNCADNESVESEDSLFIRLDTSCPDGDSQPDQRPLIKFEFTDGENEWLTWLKLTPVSPNFIMFRIVSGNVIPNTEQARELNLYLKNIGEQDAGEVNVRLISLDFGISVLQDSAIFPALGANRAARIDGDPFIVKGKSQTLPGSDVRMLLICQLENGFIDSCNFTLQIGHDDDEGPMGPDNFGYFCLDDTDEDWATSPRYDWIEISPIVRNRVFNGTECDFDGNSPQNIGEVQVVDLGFNTQFYGNSYDQITICSNGYILVGDQEYGLNFQNWPLDRGFGAGCGVIAPFWDWLDFSDDSHIYYYYDEDEGRFIIEWYKMQHHINGDDDLTFQVILYDKDVHRTLTGNQPILFQYRTITDIRGGGNWIDQVPYASVGISSPDGTTGISYLFNNEYPDGAASLEASRTILFTTDLAYNQGILYGSILDAETGDPVVGSLVTTSFGYNTLTDNNGNYRMIDVPAEILQTVKVTMDGYNDSTVTLTNDMLLEGDSLDVSFDLLHPTFTPSTDRFSITLDPEFEWESEYTVTNNGNGTLYWNTGKRLYGQANMAPWEHRISFFVGDSTNDARIKGVCFVNDQFIITGGGRAAEGDNFFYTFDRNGNSLDQEPQFRETNFGMTDLAWDGTMLWGVEQSTVIGFSAEFEEQTSFQTSFNSTQIQVVAWDSDRSLLWISGKTTDISSYDRDGNEISQIPRFGFRINGLSYWPEDPDGYPLYVSHVVNNSQSVVHKINPDTEDTLLVSILDHPAGGNIEGAFITNTYDPFCWVFMCIANDAGHDRIDIWQLDSRREWFEITVNDQEQRSGTIESRQTESFLVSVNSFDLPTIPFESYFLFQHNAAGGSDTLKILLDVIGGRPPSEFNLLSPEDGELVNGNEQDNVVFNWAESIDPNWGDLVHYELWIKSDENSLVFGTTDSTTLSVDLSELNIQFDQGADSLEWWVLALSEPDTTISSNRFNIQYIPNSQQSASFTPVKFGLHDFYPQPFNSMMTIRFGLEKSGQTTLRIFDLSGREITTLIEGSLKSGQHKAIWRAADLPSGVYVIQLASAGRVMTSKAVFMK